MKKLLITLLTAWVSTAALATQPIIINQPDGGQTVCIVQGSYITCY